MDIVVLKQNAEYYRMLYNCGKCTREEAKEYIQPYLNAIYEKSKEIAKKYNKRPVKVGLSQFLR